MTFEQKTQIFFRDTKSYTKCSGEKLSTLFISRRDINTCFNINSETNEHLKPPAIFAGTITMFSSIDLLAKMRYGDKEESGKRFKIYFKEYIYKNNIEEIYQLRNALVHSFSLYSEKGKHIYKFELGNNLPKQLVVMKNDNIYRVDVGLLHELYEASIINFYNFIQNADESSKIIFEKMFEKYGSIAVN